MSLIITTSYLKSHCNMVQQMLVTAGVNSPVPATGDTPDPHDLCKKLRAAYVKREVNSSKAIPPEKIGKAWQMKAAELVIANAEQDHWGWTDNRILPLLEFWAEFEPGARFALFYSDSCHAVSGLDIANGENAREQMDALLSEWQDFNDALLRFYSDHQDRCLLANIDAIKADPDKLKAALSSKLELDTDTLTFDAVETGELSPILSLVSPAFSDPDSQTARVFGELEAMADCRGTHGSNTPPDFTGILAEHLSAARELEQARSDNELLTLQLENVQEELETLYREGQETRQALQEALDEKEVLAKEKEALSEDKDKLAREKETSLTEAEDFRQIKAENELLQLQIEQVQEELEYQFKQTQQLSAKIGKEADSEKSETAAGDAAPPAAPAPATRDTNRPPQSGKIRIDMRQFINGMNWYDPEHDGRWAGPGTRSTVRLPSLSEGRYKLTMNVVSTMSRKIFDRMEISVDNAKLRTKSNLRTNLHGPLGMWKRTRAKLDSSVSPFPAEIEASFKVGKATGEPGELVLEFPEAVSPAERGEPDSRHLTARISEIIIERQ